MFDNSKTKLIKEIKVHLESHPEDAPEFLTEISKALENYKSRVEKLRNSQAGNAIRGILGFVTDSKKFKKLEENSIPFIIDTLFYIFPEGKPTGHAYREIETLNSFTEQCIEVDILNNPEWSDWLKRTKDQDYFSWMEKILENYKERNLKSE